MPFCGIIPSKVSSRQIVSDFKNAELILFSTAFTQTSYHVTTGQGLATNQLTVLMQQLAGKNDSGDNGRQIVLKDIDKTYFIKMDDILYCEAEGSYTKFYISNSEPIFVSRNLRSYEELLAPAGFIRTHHSCLVNPNKIKVYDITTGKITSEYGKSNPGGNAVGFTSDSKKVFAGFTTYGDISKVPIVYMTGVE